MDVSMLSDTCQCIDCARFCAGTEDLEHMLEIFGSDRRVSNRLIVARDSVREAWSEWQQLQHHQFEPAEPDESEEDEFNAGHSDEEAPELHEWNQEIFGFDGIHSRTPAQGRTDRERLEGERHYKKFMVCDHCMAHALPCNEAAVCDQCEYFSQPCVHRLCRLSPDSKSACQRMNCRYTHKDNIRTAYQTPWIVLPGKLPKYLERGLMPRRFEWSHQTTRLGEDAADLISMRQEDMLDMFHRMVRDGQGTLEELRWVCDCEPEVHPGAETIDPDSRTHDSDIASSDLAEADDPRWHFRPPSANPPLIAWPEGTQSNMDASSLLAGSRRDDPGLHLYSAGTTREEKFCACGSRENYVALYECGHWQCHACAIVVAKLKTLAWESHVCPVCNASSVFAIFANDLETPFAEFKLNDVECVDCSRGIKYETGMIMRDSMWVLEQERPNSSDLADERAGSE